MPRSVFIGMLFLSILTISISCEDPEGTLGDSFEDELLDERGFPVQVGYQAENRTAASGCKIASNHAGFTGTGFIDYGGNGTWIEWNNVNVPQAGVYSLTFRYAVGGSPRQSAIIVNGSSNGNLGFANTGSWTTWRTNTKAATLRQGRNTIRVQANTGNGGPNLDSMNVELIGGPARITARGENQPREGKEKAFDGRTDTKWLDFADSTWIQYEYGGGASKAVNKYTITSANDYPERDPRDWRLMGSNNGSSWTTLDTRRNQTFSARFQKKTYTFSNTTKYRIYRLEISSNLNPPAANSTQLAQIEYIESAINDECPDDPNKTEPGECGCGVPEGSCNDCTNVLLAHEKLVAGEHICSENRRYEFGLSPQGELAIWAGAKISWSAGTFGSTVHLVMQGDGNLVLYNAIKPLWDTKTHGNPGATLKLENDGRVVIRLGGAVIWSRGGGTDNNVVDASTLDGKIMAGYQGWFNADGDGSGMGWRHWSRGKPNADNITIDMWPDLRELDADELYETSFQYSNGRNAGLYSAYNRKTVERHVKWMKDYGIDGVFVQRFIGEAVHHTKVRDRVLGNIRSGSEKYGRVFANMYDISGGNSGTWAEDLKKDWMHLVDDQKITQSSRYLRHNGRPVLAIWGFGFGDRPGNPSQAASLIRWLTETAPAQYRVTIMGGVDPGWRGQSDWASVYRSLDILSPWTVGRFGDDAGSDNWRRSKFEPDVTECKNRNIDYLPVVWPGFSWWNLKNGSSPLNKIKRRGGRFFWRQVYNAIGAGANMIYVAMFDEVDEGTAMFKIAENSSQTPTRGRFVTLDADGEALPSDWYLQLMGQATKMLNNEIPLSPNLPIRP